MSDQVWTPVRILQTTVEYFKKHGVAEARLDAELLLAKALGVERIKLYTEFDRVMNEEELARYRGYVRERAAGRPAKYITGRTEFFSVGLSIDERSLIPRAESELLVERALALLKGHARDEFPLVLDLCTGSGAVVIAIAKNFAEASYIATDLSPAALELARSNAAENGVRDGIEFLIGDLFEPLATIALEGKLDVVVSNPPYVSENDWLHLPREIRKFEPRAALVAGQGGTEVQERILDQARVFLREGGRLVMEMDPSQRERLARRIGEFEEYGEPVFHKDYARACRAVEVARV